MRKETFDLEIPRFLKIQDTKKRGKIVILFSLPIQNLISERERGRERETMAGHQHVSIRKINFSQEIADVLKCMLIESSIEFLCILYIEIIQTCLLKLSWT